MGTTRIGVEHWSIEEEQILFDYYGNLGEDIRTLLPDRSDSAIYQRAIDLGLPTGKSKKWTEEELSILKEYYLLEGNSVTKRLPRRNKKSVGTKVRELGLHVTDRNSLCFRHWSEEEVKLLKTNYPLIGGEVKVLLPQKSMASVYKMANKLGLQPQPARNSLL